MEQGPAQRGQGGPEREQGEGGRHVPQGVGHAVVVMDKAAAEQQTENDHRRGAVGPTEQGGEGGDKHHRKPHTGGVPGQQGQEKPPALGPGGLAEQALELGHPQLHQSIEGHGSPPPFTAAASRRRLAWVISSISRVNSASPSPSRIR